MSSIAASQAPDIPDTSPTPPGDVRDTVRIVDRSSERGEIQPQAAGTAYKVQIGVEVDDATARDVMVVTPHYLDKSGTGGPQGLANALAANMVTYLKTAVRGYVKVYLEDFNPAAPHVPLAEATFGNIGTLTMSVGPRELALCLSYFATQNTKRHRGRLYIPHAWIAQHLTTPPGAPGPRPTASVMAGVLDFATVVLNTPGLKADFTWVVASTVDRTNRQVTDFWCNDEWDIIRSRGFRETTRQTGVA